MSDGRRGHDEKPENERRQVGLDDGRRGTVAGARALLARYPDSALWPDERAALDIFDELLARESGSP